LGADYAGADGDSAYFFGGDFLARLFIFIIYEITLEPLFVYLKAGDRKGKTHTSTHTDASQLDRLMVQRSVPFLTSFR
jgi:hypothetical protein